MLTRSWRDEVYTFLFGATKEDEYLERLHFCDNDEEDVELGHRARTPVARTPFTEGSSEAWSTIASNSIFHTASTPLAFMQLRIIKDLPIGVSFFILLGIWAGATGLSSWANYYKYIERSTPEFALEYIEDFRDITPKPGTLYFFNVTDGEGNGNNNGLHYLIYVEVNKKVRYDIKNVENAFHVELKNLIKVRAFNQLKQAQSKTIKSTVELNHVPRIMADADYVPGKRRDYWFFLLCCLSELPSASAGTILGYASAMGQSESNRILAAAILGGLNYIKNLLCDLPIIANAYGKNEKLDNMGPIAIQPGAWLIINAGVLLLLRNVAPAFLAFTTWAALSNDSILPSPIGFIIGLLLFPYIASSFLLFTMLALQKLNLQKGLRDSVYDSFFQRLLFNKSAIESSLGLEHSLANWKNPVAQFLGEILGGRFSTVSMPLQCFGWSPQQTATSLATMKAIGDFALIFGPTFDVVASFLSFFFNNTADGAKLPLTFVLLALGFSASVLGAITQWPNFVECCELRKNALNSINAEGYTRLENSDHSNHAEDNLNISPIYLASHDPKYVQVQKNEELSNGTFNDFCQFFSEKQTHQFLYEMPTMSSATH